MTDNVAQFPGFPRSVRPAPDPLGLYLRVGRNDHRELLNVLAAGDGVCFGAVFDATQIGRHKELREQVAERKLDAILDPKTQPAATPGGYSDALGALPWGVGRPHAVGDFEDMQGRRLVAALGNFVLEHGFTQVLAPTHVLRSADDPWLAVDADVTRRLRSYLDREGGGRVPIIYSLALPHAAFRDREQRRVLVGALATLPIDAVWIKVEGFGSDAAPAAAQAYIAATADFHGLGIPVVADHVGGAVGLSLLAFGAAGGIAHGVTSGERFDAGAWRKPRRGKGFAPSWRVYVPAIDAMLKRADAAALVNKSSRAKAMFGCTDPSCCPRGVKDMLENPVRHFLCQRVGEVGRLGQIPEQLRPQRFLDQHLRPMTDRALAASTINWEDLNMAKKMQGNRKRVDALRIVLGQLAERDPPQTFARLPLTRAAREGRR